MKKDLEFENMMLRYELEEATETCESLLLENESLRHAIEILEKILYEEYGVVVPIVL